MCSSTDTPPIEPWTERLRTTRARSLKGSPKQQRSRRLPSPRPTNLSSTDMVASSSSPNKHKSKSKEKSLQSLRERLKTPAKKLTSLSPVANATAKRPPAKPSVAPFFKRIEAAFQDKPTNTARSTRPAPRAQEPVRRAASPDAEDLINQLKEHYLRTATSLHKQATMRLSLTHADLNRKLTQSLVKDDEAFLADTEAHIKKLTQPLDRFRIRSQQRVGGAAAADGDGDGALRCEENSVGELIARAEEQVRLFERDVAALWKEWAVAESEVQKLLRGVVHPASALGQQGGGSVGGGDGEGYGDGDEGEEMLRRYREVVEKEIVEAEEEVVEIGEEAVAMMKDVEKDFRKTTLPDLHIFFQSIDEP
ncbi:uncharacterized protein B0T15DRAFT_549887 [Chaetomium strumarium]|uniref:Uncharacterized protein n=1 Tax=Chaetomium strumarium TaxID=1170767 RepID=A0AAJ0GXL2_9PEZI|nr:hypothetical protein B0T15DRAFT_549887 [Chaetomium strumarium]